MGNTTTTDCDTVIGYFTSCCKSGAAGHGGDIEGSNPISMGSKRAGSKRSSAQENPFDNYSNMNNSLNLSPDARSNIMNLLSNRHDSVVIVVNHPEKTTCSKRKPGDGFMQGVLEHNYNAELKVPSAEAKSCRSKKRDLSNPKSIMSPHDNANCGGECMKKKYKNTKSYENELRVNNDEFNNSKQQYNMCKRNFGELNDAISEEMSESEECHNIVFKKDPSRTIIVAPLCSNNQISDGESDEESSVSPFNSSDEKASKEERKSEENIKPNAEIPNKKTTNKFLAPNVLFESACNNMKLKFSPMVPNRKINQPSNKNQPAVAAVGNAGEMTCNISYNNFGDLSVYQQRKIKKVLNTLQSLI